MVVSREKRSSEEEQLRGSVSETQVRADVPWQQHAPRDQFAVLTLRWWEACQSWSCNTTGCADQDIKRCPQPLRFTHKWPNSLRLLR